MNIKRNIIFTLESRKKDGVPIVENVPVRMRVIYMSKRIEFTTGYRIDVDKWDADKQRVKNGCTNKLKQSASDINSKLNKYETQIHDIFKEYELKEIMPTPDQIKEAFNNKQKEREVEKQKFPFYKMFDEFVKERGAKNDWTVSTYEKFSSVKNHLLSFDKGVEFNDWDESKLTEYVNFLRNKKGMRNSTIDNQLDFLRWFLRWGMEKEYNQNRAFETFKPKLKMTQKKVIFLTWSELNQLREYQIPETKKYLERVRDVFLFQCYTGLRYSDVYNLKKSDVKNNHIEVTTIKTADSLTIELNNYSRAILDKYKNIHFENNKALPVISNQKMNNYLKELGEFAGINEPIRETFYKGNARIDEVFPKYELLGTHAGRRTFICNALAMGIPAQVVMSWSGHSDYKSMKPYIAVADDDKREAMKLWDKKESDETDKILEKLKELDKEQLAELLKKLK
ncbi:site-specific integrase [Dysgonomonas sp. Marseille-P4677]|nr:site-specific integrase [Dysgonomonas sp. Marseille-P4677]